MRSAAKLLPAYSEEENETLVPQKKTSSSVVQCIIAVALWMSLSSGMVFYNKWLLFELGFGHPVFLTWLQMSSISCGLLVYYKSSRSAISPYDTISQSAFWRLAAPIGTMSTLSIVLRNYVFLHLSVASMQILAASAPVIVYGVSCLRGIDRLRLDTASAVVVCCLGVALASAGALQVSGTGVALQLIAILIEAFRATQMKMLLLDTEFALDSMACLYIVAPFSAVLLFAPAFVGDFESVIQNVSGGGAFIYAVLLGNALVAGALNISAFHLLRTVSVLTASLSGIAKDCVIVVSAAFAGQKQLTPIAMFGWALSTVSLCWYSFLQSAAAAK